MMGLHFEYTDITGEEKWKRKAYTDDGYVNETVSKVLSTHFKQSVFSTLT